MIEDAKDFLKRCLEFYSPSGQEKEFSEFIAAYLEHHDFLVNFDKVGNILAKKGIGEPIILLVSHLDTISGELPVIEKDGKLYGRGAVDCKPSLAAMVYSIAHYDFNQLNKGTIIFGGIIREEDSLIGINEFIKSNITPNYAIFGEPTKVNQICIGYKGRICIGFRILTESGHVASSWQYVNAIEVGLEIWNIIKGVCWQLNETYCLKEPNLKYFNQIIPNLTVITGGMLTNCIPSECIVQVDIRFPPNITAEFILEKLRQKIIDFKHVYENQIAKRIQIQENVSSLIEGFEVDGENMIIGALRWAIFNTCNEKPKLIKKTGTTFINMIGIHYGIPSITYGPGDPKLEHTVNEFIDINEFLTSIKIYSRFYTKFFELYHNKSKDS
ncbi:MAG: M20/M25/M40 family metallo-hydrolase [Promethearchaeota archaeon]|nr:MAG: M20/M25/M40 family metallo-hydrolase [Candidatus Lokiarchaeota archaeon]